MEGLYNFLEFLKFFGSFCIVGFLAGSVAVAVGVGDR